MNPTFAPRSRVRPAVAGWRAFLFAAAASTPLAAQHPLDVQPLRGPDPAKGMHDPTPPTAEEQALLRSPSFARGARQPGTGGALDAVPALPQRVLFDALDDGQLWAATPAYKASFDTSGFVYVPFLGADAPRNHPVRFTLRSVHAGGTALPLAADAAPARDRERVSFVRGAVTERYDLSPLQVEQTFVVDTDQPGDVVVEIAVHTDLAEDAATPGIQFGNDRGVVHYGNAHVVLGTELVPVPTTWAAGTIRIHVPAALRGDGPLVIDPIIHTSAFTWTGGQPNAQPDIAYDASYDVYMIVWEYHFSAADVDVYSEFRNGDGTAIAGSIGIIDSSTTSCAVPRIANLNKHDSFLVVVQRYIGNLWQIYGRIRPAGLSPNATLFSISNPTIAGHCINPDIGGDSSVGPNGDNWCVVWQCELSATNYDIHGRIVRNDMAHIGPTLLIEASPNTIFSHPSISQSNGNGFTANPRWMVAYQFRYSATDWDVYGATINQIGNITTPSTALDVSTLNDVVPSVSTPNTDASGNPLFLLTYERQNPLVARARLLSASFANQIPAVDLTATFGLGPFWVRAECDGNRFAVLTGGSTISVATLAYTGSALVMQDTPQPLFGTPWYPRLCSKRSGGGERTEYGIVHVDDTTSPDRIMVTAYGGHATMGGLLRRTMGCNGLGIDGSGRPCLGETVTLTLNGVGGDVPGFAFGTAIPASTSFCGACPLGVDLVGVVVIPGTTLSIPIPTTASLVGYAAAVQGFALGTGPCTASLRFSDVFDLRIQ